MTKPVRDAIDRTIARAFQWPFLEATHIIISCGTLLKVGLDLATVKRCVPLAWQKKRVVLLVDDPLNGVFLLSNPQLFGPPYNRKVEIVMTHPEIIDVLLEKRRSVVKG